MNMPSEVELQTLRRSAIDGLPENFVLSVIVPIYNESAFIDAVIDRLRATNIPLQIILVDDGSIDQSGRILDQHLSEPDIILIRHPENRGKGAAIRSGMRHASGDVIVIQDADPEYDPSDFRILLEPILSGTSDVVYGNRYGKHDPQTSPRWHRAVNRLISGLTNLALGSQLSDVETCYKMAKRESFEAISPELRESRFGIEIEITARWIHRGLRFAERPIRYQHRSYAEGKKIGWRDGLSALRCIVVYGWLRR